MRLADYQALPESCSDSHTTLGSNRVLREGIGEGHGYDGAFEAIDIALHLSSGIGKRVALGTTLKPVAARKTIVGPPSGSASSAYYRGG